nr:O-phosphoserine--tRNA ligase [Methanothermus fervidus]
MKKKKIIALAEKDFEKAWKLSKKTLKEPHHDLQYPRLYYRYGKSHPLYDTIFKLREAYLKLGFDEVVNPVFINEDEVYKQFGPEAPAILDRCFYLAGLPRPDIGIEKDKIKKIKNLKSDADIGKLKEVFREYKLGNIAGDDLVYEISNALDVDDETALRILEIFPEIKKLKPQVSDVTLRSHMTASWFVTLSKIHDKYRLPIKLFSIDRCFRREQREDESHLMTYFSASCVFVDEEVSIDVGKAVAEGILRYFGFSNFKFIPDEKRSKYYIPDTQTEVYAYHPKIKKWIEVATFGLYSPIALAKYNIDKEVMNLGIGVERLAMVLENEKDVRKLVYPQFYGEWKISDRELASMLKIDLYPVTEEGRKLMKKIIEGWKRYKDEPSPCEFKIFSGKFLNKKIVVKAIEPEKNTKLLGPAIENQVYVYDGNIVGVPKKGVKSPLAEKAKKNGINTNISYMDSLAAKVSYKIEELVVSGGDYLKLRTAIARSLSDVNLKLDKVAMKYITKKNKEIDVRGPIFATIECKVKE